MNELNRMNHWLRALPVAVLLVAIPACGGRKYYPDPVPGWHSSDYAIIFGRLQKADAQGMAQWIIRYDYTDNQDPYRGRFVLVPPQLLRGYSGGEQVEVRGNILNASANSATGFTSYQIKSIRIWHSEVQH